MKAIMYGAGNIGRGFIGPLLTKCGYETVFVDVNQDVVSAINKEKKYPQEIVGAHGYTNWITNIRAVDGNDTEAVCEEIATADILATSVGVHVLEKIVPILAMGLTKRWDQDSSNSIDLLICENLMNADTILEHWLLEALPDRHKETMKSRLGLVETSIGRMVPIMTEDMRKGDFLRICVEEYDYLPVDQNAFTRPIPNYDKIVAYTPFSYYLERKLYIHNMAHAMTAFLGKMKNYTYIYEAISDISIRKLVEGAMIESAMAISAKYNQPFPELKAHIDDLLLRFQNKQLKDTVERVGRDPLRKLMPSDRLVGAARNCETQNILPIHLSFAIACGLHYVTIDDIAKVLKNTCCIDSRENLGQYVTSFLCDVNNETVNLSQVIYKIDHLYHTIRGPIC